MGKEVESGPPPCPPPSYVEAMGGGRERAFTPPPIQQQPTTLQQPTIVTTVMPMGPNSTRMMCPQCLHEIATFTRPVPGMIAYVSGLVILAVGGWCGCCLIPCCIDDCMDMHHYCPSCNAYLGRFRR